MFKRILIANRGAIATRIIRTLKKLDIESVVVYHEKDQDSLHVQHADVAVSLGAGTVAETYLNQDKIIQIAIENNVDAVHPGYGFLSENPKFVERCESHGLKFIGPTPQQMNVFGLKHLAREAAEKAKVPLLKGSPVLADVDDAVSCAEQIGFPVMLKSSAGGGGIGMQVCWDAASLAEAWESVRRLSANYFSDDRVFLYRQRASHRSSNIRRRKRSCHCIRRTGLFCPTQKPESHRRMPCAKFEPGNARDHAPYRRRIDGIGTLQERRHGRIYL
jgi:urea carboxylase